MSNTKTSTSGCFSTVFRRLLCSGSPQTHPSDHIVESNSNEFAGEEAKPQVVLQNASESSPGIVARLMGLDSLPEKSCWVHEGRSPGPVTRSRSVNFMDYMLEFDLTQAKHRRVKTSASFREVPQGLHHNQNHEFFVVYLDNVDKNKESAFKPRKYEKGDGSSTSKHTKPKENVREKVAYKKQSKEKNKKISKLKNEPRTVSGKTSLKNGSCINGARNIQTSRRGANSKAKGPLKMVNQKQEAVSVHTRKKKNQPEVKKVEFENESQGSSPVSVLDANDFAAHQENDISENSLELKSKKKCSSNSVKCNSHTLDISARIPLTEGHSKEEFTKKNFESTDIQETEYYMELISKPFELTEEDIKFSNWINTKKVFTFEDFEEICAEFGERILDLMLHQEADELMGLDFTCKLLTCNI